MLQGQYAFVVYDSHRKQAFAARDPSGRESLYYSFDDDDGLRCFFPLVSPSFPPKEHTSKLHRGSPMNLLAYTQYCGS